MNEYNPGVDTPNHPPVRHRTPPPRQQVQDPLPSQPASSGHRPILHLRPNIAARVKPQVARIDPPKQVHSI
jgi:hypothetical protein